MTASTVTRDLLYLIEAWEELVNKPAELVFSKTLYHDLLIVADIVSDAIEASKDLDKWDRTRVSDFNNLLGTSGVELSFIKASYPSEFVQLQQATTANPAGRYNLQDINQAAQTMISAIRQPLYLMNLCRELEGIYLAAMPDAKERITVLVDLLLVRMTEQASDKTLEKHGPNIIARTFLEMHIVELESALQKPTVADAFSHLMEDLLSGFKIFIGAPSTSSHTPAKEKATNLAKHLIESEHETSSRIGLFFVTRMFDGVVFQHAVLQEMFDISVKRKWEQNALISRYSGDPFWLQIGGQWFDEFAKEAVLFLTRFFLESSSPGRLAQSDSAMWLNDYQQQISRIHESWENYSEIVADNLISTNLFGDFETELPKEFQVLGRSKQPHSAKDRLKRIPKNHLTFDLALEMGNNCIVNITRRQKRNAIQQMIRVMVREIFHHLKEAADRGEVDPAQLSGFDVSGVLNARETQRRIVSLLKKWLELITERFFKSSRLIDVRKRSSFLLGDLPRLEAALHQLMVRRVTEDFGGFYVLHLVDRIQLSEVGPIIRSLASAFTLPQKAYQVIGIIDGLDMRGRSAKVGSVRLYDARVWDYGESNILDIYEPHAYRGVVERYAPQASNPLMNILSASLGYKGVYGNVSDQFVRHSARATITVVAVGSERAQQLARIEIQQVLDTLTWSQTRGEERSFAPKFELLPYFAVIVSDGQSMKVITDDDSPRLILLNAEESGFLQVAQTYDKLLGRPVTSQTPVESAVMRAVHWLARGYWETYPPDKFLNYWIALEQLLVQPGEGKLAGVRSRLPELVATWFHNDIGQEILKVWRDLLAEIKDNPNLMQQVAAHPSFSDWHVSAAVLLRNMSTLEQIDVTNVLTSIVRLKALMDKGTIAAIQNEWQEKLRYKIELLNRRRNVIVHEGFSYSTDMHYFTEALWDVANRAVMSVLDRVGAKPGQYQTTDDIIRDYQIPW